MNGRLQSVLAFATAALLATPILLSEAALSAQDAQGRFRVLVPRFFPDEGTDHDFGRDTADRIREALDALPSYTAPSEDDIEDEFDEHGVDMNDLIEGENSMPPCLGFQQLGGQMGVEIAMCVNYRETGDDMVEVYNIQFWQLESQQSFDIDPFTMHKDDDEEAADHIMASFDAYTELQNFRRYCYDYAQSQEWDSALRNCNQALERNPGDLPVLSQRAQVHQEQGDLEAALEDVEAILEVDPINQNALSRGGYVAVTLGRNEEGREYYSRYLEMNPGDVAVRRNIAHQSYQAGDALGAMLLVDEGLEVEPDNINLLLDRGNFAFVAADDLNTTGQQDSEALSPEVVELYESAVDAYMQVYEQDPDTLSVSALGNIMVANIQLGTYDRAVELGGRILQNRPDEARLWAIYADAQRRSGDLDGALEAMSEVADIDPGYNDLYLRQGLWMVEAGRVEEAIPLLRQAAENGEGDPGELARNILAVAHPMATQEGNYSGAVDLLALAKESFELPEETLREFNFFHGYFIFEGARLEQDAGTLEAAQATLPRFQEARTLFEAARGFTGSGVNVEEFLANTDAFIDIQEAVIRRGGG